MGSRPRPQLRTRACARLRAAFVSVLGGADRAFRAIGRSVARRAASRAPDGRLRWATHFGGDGKEWAGEFAVDSRGALFVEGAVHTDFSFERPRCEAVPGRVVARDHPNSLLFVEPGADPRARASACPPAVGAGRRVHLLTLRLRRRFADRRDRRRLQYERRERRRQNDDGRRILFVAHG